MIVAIYSFIFYLILTAFTGEVLIWGSGEIILAFVAASLTTFSSAKILKEIEGINFLLNPIRVLYLLVYLIPFFFRVSIANLKIAYRVVTGKMNPGIVRIDPELESDAAITILANSITLTPGTLTVDEKNGKLFVHWIDVKEDFDIKDVCGNFPAWARRIAE